MYGDCLRLISGKNIRMLVVVVYIFRYFRLYLQKSIEKIKKREEAEPQGQALENWTCRGAKWTKMINNEVLRDKQDLMAVL